MAISTTPAQSSPVVARNSESHAASWGKQTVHIDRLVQERRNSIALAMELRLSCTNPVILPTPLCRNVNSQGSTSILRLFPRIEIPMAIPLCYHGSLTVQRSQSVGPVFFVVSPNNRSYNILMVCGVLGAIQLLRHRSDSAHWQIIRLQVSNSKCDKRHGIYTIVIHFGG